VSEAPIAITEAESELMQALWRGGPLSPASLFAEVQARRPWRRPTIKTLLARLMRKGAVRADRGGRQLVYRPTVDRAGYIAAEVDALVERLFDGDAAALERFLRERKPR
jgi:BlaI family transcriptional regulator, penicillinase repressor